MRDFIAERLAEMKDPVERTVLRELMESVFLPLYDETEAKYTALEKRVHDELPLMYDTYTVYSTVLPRTQIAGHPFLSPMVSGDLDEAGLSAKELTDALRGGEHPAVETVFFAEDYLKCRRLERDKVTLDGAFVTQSGKYAFRCRLEPAKRYMSCVERMYTAFIRNHVPWTTVNCGYLRKFFDVCVVSMDTLPGDAKILGVEINYGPHETAVTRGLIPVWNSDIHRVKSDSFPEPALDNINYEYQFDTGKLGSDNGFLVDYDNTYVLSTRREKNAILVVSPQSKGFVWDLFRLRRRQDASTDRYPYPLLSNARRDSFSARLMLSYGTHITTKAEMRKLLTSFETEEYVELVNFHFSGEQLAGDTYEMNPFILDEIRDPSFQKTLVLSFRAKNRDFFLNRDIVSFLVSEFQTIYPEYRCVGALV